MISSPSSSFAVMIERVESDSIGSQASTSSPFTRPAMVAFAGLTDIQRDIHRTNCVVKMALAAIRKRNYRHFMSLFAVVPRTKEHIQNYIIIIIIRLRRSSRFTLRK